MKKNERPDKVSTAITLLWITLATGIVRGFMEFSNSLKLVTEQGFGEGFLIFEILFSLAFLYFFIYMIGKRKNWARITFLVLFIIGIAFTVSPLINSLLTNPLSGILGVIQIILQIIALILLFQKTSSCWFK